MMIGVDDDPAITMPAVMMAAIPRIFVRWPVKIDGHAMVITTSTSPTMVIETARSDASVYQIFLDRADVPVDHDHLHPNAAALSGVSRSR